MNSLFEKFKSKDKSFKYLVVGSSLLQVVLLFGNREPGFFAWALFGSILLSVILARSFKESFFNALSVLLPTPIFMLVILLSVMIVGAIFGHYPKLNHAQTSLSVFFSTFGMLLVACAPIWISSVGAKYAYVKIRDRNKNQRL